MSSTDIMMACLQRLATLPYSPAPDVIYPGLKAQPPDDEMWLEARYFPSEPFDDAWADGECPEQRGFFQVLVGYRPGMGEEAPSELADAVVAHFPKGTDLSGVVVRKMPTRAPSFEDGDKCFIPVTVNYRGFAE